MQKKGVRVLGVAFDLLVASTIGATTATLVALTIFLIRRSRYAPAAQSEPKGA